MKLSKVADILSCGESVVQAPTIGHDTKCGFDRHRILRGIKSVDPDFARIRREQRVEHAQRSGFTGAIGAEEPGDLAIAGLKCHAVNRFYLAERLVQICDLNHGLGPNRLVKNGDASISSTQVISTSSVNPAAIKSVVTFLKQGCFITECD